LNGVEHSQSKDKACVKLASILAKEIWQTDALGALQT
jgi:hypothetical protein